jgi:hypothetical protein
MNGGDPTYEDFLRHAQHFGAECVVETAEHYLPRREVLLLKLECSRVKGNKSPRGGGVPESVGKSLTREERAELVCLFAAEGLVEPEIAATLGIGVSEVRRALTKLEERAA